MRKPSKMVAREELVKAERERDMLARALQCALVETPAAVERFAEPNVAGAKYTFRLFRPTAADGGIVVTTFEYPGQRPQVNAYRLDEMLTWATFTAELIAIDRLRQARDRAWATEQ